MDIPTAVTIICIVGILGIVLSLSRRITISNWLKNENHRTTGGSCHGPSDGDSPDMSSRDLVDFKTDVDLDCDKRKRRG